MRSIAVITRQVSPVRWSNDSQRRHGSSAFVTESAVRFVRAHPPTRPCIAEYGGEFPAALASYAAPRLPYIEQFATVDWHLGRLALAVDSAPLQTLTNCDTDRVLAARLTLQHGIRYVALDWPLDELIRFYLSGDAPNQFALRHEPVWLELRGCRGELWLNRLTKGDYAFRLAVAGGSTLGCAAELAIGADQSFDPGRAVVAVLDAGLVTGVTHPGGDES